MFIIYMFLVNIFFFFKTRSQVKVSLCSPGCPRTCSVHRDSNLEIHMSLPLKCWDSRCIQTSPGFLMGFLRAQNTNQTQTGPAIRGTGETAEGKQALCSKETLFQMGRSKTLRHSAQQGGGLLKQALLRCSEQLPVGFMWPWHLKKTAWSLRTLWF